MRKEEVFESFTVVSVVVGMDPGARAVISDAVLGPGGARASLPDAALCLVSEFALSE